MSIEAVGAFTRPVPVKPYSGVEDPSASSREDPEGKDRMELTTVTTHCNQKHKHGPQCPHTVSTRPAPANGPGSRLNMLV